MEFELLQRRVEFELWAEFMSQARVRVTGTMDMFQKKQELLSALKMALLKALRGAAVVVLVKLE